MASVKTMIKIHDSDVPNNSSLITKHVLYKVKVWDDGTKILKARIGTHGNRDREKTRLKTDSATCLSVGIRILLSISAIFKWQLAKID